MTRCQIITMSILPDALNQLYSSYSVSNMQAVTPFRRLKGVELDKIREFRMSSLLIHPLHYTVIVYDTIHLNSLQDNYDSKSAATNLLQNKRYTKIGCQLSYSNYKAAPF